MGNFIEEAGKVLTRSTRQPSKGFGSFTVGTETLGLPGELAEFGKQDPAPPANILDDVTDLNTALEEFQLRQQGFRSIPLQGGGFTIQPIPEAELDAFLGSDAANRLRSQRRISQLSLGRTEAAFEGNLPVSQGFERDAAERRRQIISGLQREGGVTSSAGIESLGRLRESEDITREQIRAGEITSGFGRQLSQEQFESQRIAQILGGFQQGRVGATQLGFQQQDMQNQLRIAQMMGQFGAKAGQQELLGTIGGAAIGAAGAYYTGGASNFLQPAAQPSISYDDLLRSRSSRIV